MMGVACSADTGTTGNAITVETTALRASAPASSAERSRVRPWHSHASVGAAPAASSTG
jgi:hypothetical protein